MSLGTYGVMDTLPENDGGGSWGQFFFQVGATLLTALIIGMFSAYLTAHATINNLENRVGTNKDKIKNVKSTNKKQNEALKEQQVFRRKVTNRLSSIETTLQYMRRDIKNLRQE